MSEDQKGSTEGNEPEAFGVWLRRQREGREIDLREIAETSKISIRYLQALETGRFDLLPAPVFAKGFLRQYAGYVGLDPEEVVNAFLDASSDGLAEGEETAIAPPTRGAGAGWLAIIILVILLLVALVAWLGRRGLDRPETMKLAASASVADPLEQGVDESATPSNEGEDTSTGDAAVEPMGLDSEDGEVASQDEAVEGEEPSVGKETPAPLRVVVDFLDACWVEASIDGVPTVAETKVQGESLPLDANETIVLKVGNASAVEVEVNGKPWPVGAQGASVRQWTFNAPVEDRGE